MLAVTGRTSAWVERFNIRIKRIHERPDQPTGDVVYKVKDIFTTHLGSWELDNNRPGEIEPWARAQYLRREFDDAGADHHLFARVLDLEGNPITEDIVSMWSDGFDKLGDPAFENFTRLDTKEHSGWGNQPVFNKFNFEAGDSGAWCWGPKDSPSEIVCGGGLPGGMHISFFVVWQAERREENDETDNGDGDILHENSIRGAAVRKLGLQFDRNSTFANFARTHQLGVPLTDEFEEAEFRIQGFVGGIVYAPLAQPDAIDTVNW